MSDLTPAERDQYLELLAGLQLDELTPEERAQLESLGERAGDDAEMADLVGQLIITFDDAAGGEGPPGDVRSRLIAQGRRMVGGPPQRSSGPWLAAAACLLLAVGAAVTGALMLSARQAELARTQAQVAALESRVEENAILLAAAQARASTLSDELNDESARRLVLAEQLADATSALDMATLRIAQYETPVDPTTLAANREKLLEVPGTIRIAWAPFDLPDAPAEQGDVTGDVIWNDELEQGFLRFVGLDVNDPAIEQYQVWVIDERGMEQKVSGGVFDATAQGEVIVPIDPAIDVRRVALFAVTIEEPGGTWVPDLSRRVVVAPRG